MDTQNINTSLIFVKELKIGDIILINDSLCRITCFSRVNHKIRIIGAIDTLTCVFKQTMELYSSPILKYN